jgi:hypothetical protein
VCAVLLLSLTSQLKALKQRPAFWFSTVTQLLPSDSRAAPTFEWGGLPGYVGEMDFYRNRTMSRGVDYTSSDAADLFQHTVGRRQKVLIERKYAETYCPAPRHAGPSGRRRLKTYRPAGET